MNMMHQSQSLQHLSVGYALSRLPMATQGSAAIRKWRATRKHRAGAPNQDLGVKGIFWRE